MTTVSEDAAELRFRSEARRERLFARINKASGYLDVFGLGWVVPLLRIAAGDSPRHQLAEQRRRNRINER